MEFFLSLSYKEWIKMRLFVAIVLALSLALLVYIYTDLAHQERMEGASLLVYKFITGYHVLNTFIKLPLIASLTLALSQFLPEMFNKRLKLTLHLPAHEYDIIGSMLMFGVLIYAAIMLLTYVALSITLSSFLPTEYVYIELMAFLLWAVAGLTVYGFTSAVCIEPTLHNKINIALIGISATVLSFWAEYVRATYLFPMTVVLAASGLLMSVYATSRFKRGIM
ncbi:MAG: hypothetical protein IKR17_13325 [Bacteroidales bacterium]|nr:hypothetical protein [Bacteroidales bacterium]